MAAIQHLTTNDIAARVLAAHGPQIRVVGEFAGWASKMQFACEACGHEWAAKPQNVCTKTGCPMCARGKVGAAISAGRNSAKQAAFKAEIVAVANRCRLMWLNPDQPIDAATGGVRNLQFRHKTCGHEWATTFRAIRRGTGCPACANTARVERFVQTRQVLGYKPNLTTSQYQQVVHRETQGRSRLVGEWRGISQPRQIECVTCEDSWTVPAKTDYKEKLLCQDCNRKGPHSGIAIRWIEAEAKRRRIKIQHARNGGEVRIPGTNFRVDGYNERKRMVFEFYGDCWHGNPAVYAPHSLPHPYNERRASALYRETMNREQALRDLGYTVVSIWESEYRAQITAQNRGKS